MEQLSAIVAALAAGASALQTDGGNAKVKDAYAQLKKLIEDRVPAQDVALLEQQPNSEARRAVIEDELDKADATRDSALVNTAQRLLNLAEHKSSAILTGEIDSRSDKREADQVSRRTSPTRGAIRLDVSSSTTMLSSGSDFSIFINLVTHSISQLRFTKCLLTSR